MACVLFVVQTDTESKAQMTHAAIWPHESSAPLTQYQSAQQRAHTPFHDMLPHLHTIYNFTECFNRSVTLARLCTSSLRMVEDRNLFPCNVTLC